MLKTKNCPRCKIEKLTFEFSKNKTTKSGFHSQCKLCQVETNRNWMRNHSDKYRKYQKEYYRKNREFLLSKSKKWRQENKDKAKDCDLRKSYGIGKDDYDRMYKQQQGLCAICGLPEKAIHPQSKKKQPLSVDHNHNSGKVRGLLCSVCNRALGFLRVDNFGVLNLQKAVDYISENNLIPKSAVC